MKRVFFHIHLWKTAGGSFLNICRNNFGRAFHRDIMLIQEWTLSRKQLSWLLDYHKWIRCYSCHMLSGDLPYDNKLTEVIGISFVREPIDRFVSSYNYMMADNYRGGYSKTLSFDEFYARTFVNVNNPWWRNGQTYILGCSNQKDKAISLVLERIKAGSLILLVTERFDESCIILERLFPADFKDCSYIRHNVSSKKKLVTETEKNAVSRYVTLDTELHAIANDNLDYMLDRLYPNLNERRKYLNDFRKRCHVKQINSRVIKATNLMQQAVKKVILSITRIRNE